MAISKFPHKNINLIQSLSWISVFLDHPHSFGRIVCAELLNEFYGLGQLNCDHISLWINKPEQVSAEQIHSIVLGFRNAALEANVPFGGVTCLTNPHLSIGACATLYQTNEEMLSSFNKQKSPAKPGDCLILTKPLGSKLLLCVHHWLMDSRMNKLNNNKYQWSNDLWKRCQLIVNEEQFLKSFDVAHDCLFQLNHRICCLMQRFSIDNSIQINRNGLLAQAQHLLLSQQQQEQNNCEVDFVFHNLPTLPFAVEIDKLFQQRFGIGKGCSAEINGGLLIVVDRKVVKKFCQELRGICKHGVWIVGSVLSGNYQTRLAKHVNIISLNIPH